MASYHVPVLLNEVLEYLEVEPGQKYIDCTLGGGGHTKKIIEAGGIVLGLDTDQEAIDFVSNDQAESLSKKKLFTYKTNFAHLQQVAQSLGFTRVSGILFDLGVSSHQLDTAYRGFSFGADAQLDMRMDPNTQGVTARDLINAGSESELANIFWRYGDERFAKKIAKVVVETRKSRPIETTNDLASLILSVRKRMPADRMHPATRVFQALRIAVNDELETFKEALLQTLTVLAPGGRLVVLCFESLEDQIFKTFLKDNSSSFRLLTKKPIFAQPAEIANNPRSRSGRLRAAERL